MNNYFLSHWKDIGHKNLRYKYKKNYMDIGIEDFEKDPGLIVVRQIVYQVI